MSNNATTSSPAVKPAKRAAAPNPPTAPARTAKKAKPTRAERAETLRLKILDAAVQIVGEFGYQNASIGRIAMEAGVAQGTLYIYFETRQHLFDELLPHAGQHMMHFVGEQLHGAGSFAEVEERGIRAFFAYLSENPGFYRLLNEAEFAAPTGHKRHFDQLIDHYVGSMKKSIARGIMPPFTEDEMKVMSYTMMAARSYIYLGYIKYGDADSVPEHVIETYMKLVKASFGNWAG